jgi:hypothetical protein
MKKTSFIASVLYGVLLFLSLLSSSPVCLIYASHTTRVLQTYSNRDILSIFYRASGGGSWTNKENWMNAAGPCPSSAGAWFGVTCPAAEITQLALSQNAMGGQIPSQLGLLTSLTKNLLLGMNSFTGTLPSQIGQLTMLTAFFSFERNSFTGKIPSEIGQLTLMVDQFLMHSSTFSGRIPSQLGRLTSMVQKFEIFSNSLCGSMPAEVSALSSQVSGWSVQLGNSIGTPCDVNDHPF